MHSNYTPVYSYRWLHPQAASREIETFTLQGQAGHLRRISDGQVTSCVYNKHLAGTQVSPTDSNWGTSTTKRTTSTTPAFLTSSSNNPNQINDSCSYIQRVASWFHEAHTVQSSNGLIFCPVSFLSLEDGMKPLLACSIYKSTTFQINLKWNVGVALETRWGWSLPL